MKPAVLVTMRVDEHADRGEVRDALDHRLITFLTECGLNPVLVPNDLEVALSLFEIVRPAGLVLSGGNNPEARQNTEAALIKRALKEKIPVFGICHGFQQLIRLAGGHLERKDGHVRTRHSVLNSNGQEVAEVNSFHEWAVTSVPDGWEILGRTQDEGIEWARSKDKLLQGIMWHPERESKTVEMDMRIVREHFTV